MIKSKSTGKIEKDIPPLLQSSQLKFIFDKTLNQKNQQNSTNQVTDNFPPYKILNSEGHCSMNVQNMGMKENKSDNSEKVSGFVDKLLGDKGLTKKMDDKQLRKIGLNFDSWAIKDKRAYFFNIPNERSVDQLKRENLNVTKNQKFCLEKNKISVKSKLNKYLQNDNFIEKDSVMYQIENINNKIDNIDPNCSEYIIETFHNYPELFSIQNYQGQTLFQKALSQNRQDICNNIIQVLFKKFKSETKLSSLSKSRLSNHETIDLKDKSFKSQLDNKILCNKTKMNETLCMLYAKNLTLHDLKLLQNDTQSIDNYDQSNQNIITHLFKGSKLQLFVESRYLEDDIKKAHSKYVRKTVFDMSGKYLQKKQQTEKKSNNKLEIPLDQSKNIYQLDKNIMIELFKRNNSTDIELQNLKFNQNYLKSIVQEQLKQACRIIKLTEFFKSNKLDQLKDEYSLQLQNTQSNNSINEAEQSSDPVHHLMPQIFNHVHSKDRFGNTSLIYAIKNRNVFLIIYLMLVNKVKIHHSTVDQYLGGDNLLDIDRMVIWYAVQNSGVFSDNFIKWIEESNLLNMLVQKQINNLYPNPHKYEVRYKRREDNNLDLFGKQRIFYLLKKVTLERQVNNNLIKDTDWQQFYKKGEIDKLSKADLNKAKWIQDAKIEFESCMSKCQDDFEFQSAFDNIENQEIQENNVQTN